MEVTRKGMGGEPGAESEVGDGRLAAYGLAGGVFFELVVQWGEMQFVVVGDIGGKTGEPILATADHDAYIEPAGPKGFGCIGAAIADEELGCLPIEVDDEARVDDFQMRNLDAYEERLIDFIGRMRSRRLFRC